MGEVVRLVLEVLTLGRTKSALVARSAFAEQRGKELTIKATERSGKRAKKIANRAAYWARRSKVLAERAAAL